MGFKVAVAGATGNVGREMLNILEVRGFPADEVIALARECEAFTQQNRLHMTHEHIRVYRQWAACLRGSTRGPTSSNVRPIAIAALFW